MIDLRFRYFPVPPVDSMQDLRTEMVLTMVSLGIQIEAHHHEAHHHEVATGGGLPVPVTCNV